MLNNPTERPISFSDAMAAAVRAGSKTQTRRKIKLPPYYPDDEDLMVFAQTHIDECPYGIVGDILWVRETWSPRTFIELTAVRPEYLQDITEADAIAEGVVRVDGRSAIDSFIDLWDSIIKDDPFDSNPEVWVLDFKILQPFKIL